MEYTQFFHKMNRHSEYIAIWWPMVEAGPYFKGSANFLLEKAYYTVAYLRRVDHGLVFWNKSWIEYKDGFGNGMDRDYWLGLDRLHMLTNKDENVTLRIDIWGDRCILEQTISKNSELRNCSQTENGYWFREWTFQVTRHLMKIVYHIASL